LIFYFSENFDFSSSTIGFGKARDGVDGSTNKCAPIEELSFCSSLNAMQCDIQSDRDVIPPDNIDDILVSVSFEDIFIILLVLTINISV